MIVGCPSPAGIGMMLGGFRFHDPVLLDEAIDYLKPSPGGRYLDGTLGGGGHARRILESSNPDGGLWGVDLDEDAIRYCQEHLVAYGDRAHLMREDYSRAVDRWLGMEFDGAILDLGLSSAQIDDPGKGFSSRHDSPLDMRFDNRSGIPASTILNTYSGERIAEILYRYGEERHAVRIARAIVRARERSPIDRSGQLNEVIRGAIPGRFAHKSVARAYQALRIAVNRELEALEAGLGSIFGALRVGGRFVVISYHSLEDRMVKRTFKYLEADCVCPGDLPQCVCGKVSTAEVLTKRPVRPSPRELSENPRARSARLRAVRKVATQPWTGSRRVIAKHWNR